VKVGRPKSRIRFSEIDFVFLMNYRYYHHNIDCGIHYICLII